MSPQIAVIVLVARGLEKYRSSKLVNDAFGALRPAAAGLVAAAGWSVIKSSLSLDFAPFHVDPISLALYGVLVARGLEKYRSSKLVNDAFGALRPAAAGLVAAAGWSVIRSSLSLSFAPLQVDPVSLVLYGILVTLMLLPKLKKVHPVLFLAAGGLIGALLSL